MFPSPYRGRSTAYAVVHGTTGFEQLVTRQLAQIRVHAVALLVIGIDSTRFAIRLIQRIRVCFRFAHGLQRIIRIVIDGAVFRIGYHADRLRIAEVRLKSTLYLKHIAFNQFLRRRIMDLPRQIDLTGDALMGIQILGSSQVVHAVVRRDMHLVRLESLLRFGGLVDIRLESSRDKTLYCILGRDDDRTRAVGGLTLSRVQRGMVTDRALINHVLHRRATVARCTLRIQRIEIRLIELRALRNITAGVDIRPAPVVIVRLIAARLFVDRRTHTPFELFVFQARRRVPVERDIRDVLMVIVVLAFEANRILLPVRFITLGQNQLLTVVCTANNTATGVDTHITLADVIRRRVQTALHTGDRRDTVDTLVRAFRHLVPYIRVVTSVEIRRSPEVIIVRTTIHPYRDIKTQHTFTHTHDGVVFLLLQIVIRLHSHSQRHNTQ